MGNIYMIYILILTLKVLLIYGHPQCLDTDPPFQLTGSKGVFCNKYKEFGCCTDTRNLELEKKYDRIMADLTAKGLGEACTQILKDVLCQFCSPYEAHVFKLRLSFPEICPKFCSKLYQKCKDIVPHITNDPDILGALHTEEKFCDAVHENKSMYCWPDIVGNTDPLKVTQSPESKQGCLCLKEFASDLYNPMRFLSPKDHTGRIFILEQRGKIWIFSKSGQKHSKPFLDISKKISIIDMKGHENGLIGLEFHTDFKNNRRFYIHYTVDNPKMDMNGISIISEIQTDINNPNRADMSTERVIIKVEQPTSIHHAGELLFGMDGYLYIFLGDGGPSNDAHNNSQNRETLLGKILRLNVSDPTIPYTIPSDNPFVNEIKVRPEIYAYGLRNPWRADEDEGDPKTSYGKGRILFGDVGQVRWEEVNVLEKGGNYAWRGKEGTHCSDYPNIQKHECSTVDEIDVDPIGDYSHFEFGTAVVPGKMYRGCRNPSLNGIYIFGFYFHHTFRGRVFSLKEKRKNSNKWKTNQIHFCGKDVCFTDGPADKWTNRYGTFIIGFGEDDDGEIYLMTSNTARIKDGSGKVYRIIDPFRRGDPKTCRSANRAVTHVTTTPSETTTTKRQQRPQMASPKLSKNIVSIVQICI